jgi:head-tail adaptor
MARTSAGERRFPVFLDQRVPDGAVDPSGAPIDAWTPLDGSGRPEMMAKFPIGGREMFQGQQVTAPYDTRWRMAYRPDMDPDVLDVPADRRLRYENRAYNIVSAAVMGYQDEIELLTIARQG